MFYGFHNELFYSLPSSILMGFDQYLVICDVLTLQLQRHLTQSVHAGDKFIEYYYGAELIFFFDLFLFDLLLGLNLLI